MSTAWARIHPPKRPQTRHSRRVRCARTQKSTQLYVCPGRQSPNSTCSWMQPTTPTRTNKLGRGPQSTPCRPRPLLLRAKFWRGEAFYSQRSRLATQDRSAGGTADPSRTQRRIVWMLGADSPRLSDGPRPSLGFPMSAHVKSTAHHLFVRERGRCWRHCLVGMLGSHHPGGLDARVHPTVHF